MKIYKPRVLKNGAIGGYYKKNGKMVWRLLAGPKTIKGGSYTFDDVNKRLTTNINFFNLTKLTDMNKLTNFIKNLFIKKSGNGKGNGSGNGNGSKNKNGSVSGSGNKNGSGSGS